MNPDDIVTIITACISSGIFVKLLDLLHDKFNKQTTDKKMLLGIGHDMLYTKLETYLNRGWVTLDELENLAYLFEPYTELGGNGTCAALYGQVLALPHEAPKNEKSMETQENC